MSATSPRGPVERTTTTLRERRRRTPAPPGTPATFPVRTRASRPSVTASRPLPVARPALPAARAALPAAPPKPVPQATAAPAAPAGRPSAPSAPAAHPVSPPAAQPAPAAPADRPPAAQAARRPSGPHGGPPAAVPPPLPARPAPAGPPVAAAGPGAPPVISVRNLVKTYGDVRAVDGVSFDVAGGSTFAFLGTNGAGKSTTISCITTLKSVSSGTIHVAGLEVGRQDLDIRRAIGVVFQESLLDPVLSVQENLALRATFYGIDAKTAKERIAGLSSLLGLEEFLARRYKALSGGQKRRADIARALIHQPRILFLDEPTTGLDPDSRDRVWSTILDLQKRLRLTVFLTTHYMEEAERADRIAIIDHGRIVTAGTPTELRSAHAKDELRVTLRDPRRFDQRFGPRARRNGTERRITVESSGEARAVLRDFDTDITDFEFRHGTMDDVFLAITRGGAR
ncbi:ATP-binding cassette domain-containing protein [Tsukamurella tyrosinosolvens]|uniref:ABC transporter ATP-binding protein n=1 Tax=Tsukamurella tyrosinosolvens TaxID=57704 RepID=UPI001FD1526F|nr:ABC transporter ATP-binding protein [Tsukamurella tyrosinosolvens]